MQGKAGGYTILIKIISGWWSADDWGGTVVADASDIRTAMQCNSVSCSPAPLSSPNWGKDRTENFALLEVSQKNSHSTVLTVKLLPPQVQTAHYLEM